MKMGCVNSKADINDTHPNIFHVTNVNDRGRAVSRGKLEVTESELILHQKGKNPIVWPLRSLRKYGWDVDTDVFSIECGRRSPTGPGYYAFKCRKAEQLFNMVQHHIIGGIQDNANNAVASDNHLMHNVNHNSIDPSVLGANTGPPLQRRPDLDGGHVNSMQSKTRPHVGVLSRPGSISSNGQLSPTAISPPPTLTPVIPLEHNNNKHVNPIAEENGVGAANYVNVGAADIEATSHVYMNVDAKEIVNSLSQNSFTENREPYQRELSEEVHCYANIDSRDVESLQMLQQQSNSVANVILPNNSEIVQMYMSNSVPCTPTTYDAEYLLTREVNYAELDLGAAAVKRDNGNYMNGHAGGSQPKPISNASAVSIQDSPTLHQKKSYATIDFPKTIALSQSINPKADMEEGSRKTRHNSTINSFSD